MLPQVKVSVVMSVYNGDRYLRESIESILNQTFTEFEFIIIDDASKDSSWNILTEYAHQDQRVRLFKNDQNIGLTKSLNKGLKLARGEYIARQDADDVSLPQRLQKQVELLSKSPEVVLVSCNIDLIDAQGGYIDTQQRSGDRDLIPWYLLFYNHLAGHSQVIFRQKPVEKLGYYAQHYRYAQDYELWSRLINVGDIVILPDVLLQQRRHEQSISAAKQLDQASFSRSQARHNIKQLLGEELSLEEVDALYGFWLGHWCSSFFPASQNAISIHFRLQEIYRAFILQAATQQNSSPDLSLRLRMRIAQQLACWARNFSLRQEFLLKVKLSIYILSWHRLTFFGYWFTEIRKILQKIPTWRILNES